MTITIKLLLEDQRLIDAPFKASSLEELNRLEPAGIYTVARTHYATNIVMLDAHLDRLEESAELESIPLQLNRASLRGALRETLAACGYENARLRITISRDDPNQILIAAEPLRGVPSEIVSNGAEVATHCIARPNPRAKSNAWIGLRTEASRSLPEHVYEGVVCNSSGELLEGFSSNFYAVKDGKLWTAGDNVLFGIARKIILVVAQDLLPLHLHPVMIKDIPSMQEAFLSSSSRGLVPIVKIDGRVVGEGKPGPYTLEITRRYNSWVEENLEPI
ncbi:MAG: aminotransferase class IV [Anaerolineales bacterium]|nr:aminotransferase class IV [Anaerolineales bacterium]